MLVSVLMQEETRVPEENLRCLVGTNWQHPISHATRGNFPDVESNPGYSSERQTRYPFCHRQPGHRRLRFFHNSEKSTWLGVDRPQVSPISCNSLLDIVGWSWGVFIDKVPPSYVPQHPYPTYSRNRQFIREMCLGHVIKKRKSFIYSALLTSQVCSVNEEHKSRWNWLANFAANIEISLPKK